MSVIADRLAPSGIDAAMCEGALSIDSNRLQCPAWWVLDLAQAWYYGRRRPGSRDLPGVSGSRAYRRRRTGTEFKFRTVFGGKYTALGTPASDDGHTPGEQLYVNWQQFQGVIVADPGGDGTRTSTLTTPIGVQYTWPVQVVDCEPGQVDVTDDDAVMRATLVLFVPRGGWIL